PALDSVEQHEAQRVWIRSVHRRTTVGSAGMTDAASTETVVRRAGPDDMETLLTLVAEYCEADGHAFDPEGARAALEPLLAGDTVGTAWVIDEEDGYVV